MQWTLGSWTHEIPQGGLPYCSRETYCPIDRSPKHSVAILFFVVGPIFSGKSHPGQVHRIKRFHCPKGHKMRILYSSFSYTTLSHCPLCTVPSKMSDAGVPRLATTIHVTALDGIVNVNSLFTLAVFIGLSWNPNDPDNRLNQDPNCQAGPKVAENLVAFHVYSFSSFLFSSLIALGLKQAIRLARTARYRTIFTVDLAHVNKNALRVGYLVSAAGSASGCLFLMLALINVVQIKLGTLSCGSPHSFGAVVPLLILVPIALLIYVFTVFYAFTQ